MAIAVFALTPTSGFRKPDCKLLHPLLARYCVVRSDNQIHPFGGWTTQLVTGIIATIAAKALSPPAPKALCY